MPTDHKMQPGEQGTLYGDHRGSCFHAVDLRENLFIVSRSDQREVQCQLCFQPSPVLRGLP